MALELGWHWFAMLAGAGAASTGGTVSTSAHSIQPPTRTRRNEVCCSWKLPRCAKVGMGGPILTGEHAHEWPPLATQ